MKQQPYWFPTRLEAKYTDPFTKAVLCTMDLRVDRKRSADGFYSRYVKNIQAGLRSVCSRDLQGRTPRVALKLY